MCFTKDEAIAKRGKRVRVCINSFSEENIPKGTTGKVEEAQLVGRTGTGPGQVINLMEEIWVISIQFDDPSKTLIQNISKEEYERCLKEI